MTRTKQLAELLGAMQAVDLSHAYEENMQVAPFHNRYFHNLWDAHATGSMALSHQLVMNEHTGTHMDATAHFLAEGHAAHCYMDETPIDRFYGRALTLDFSHCEAQDNVKAEEIQRWERDNLAVEAGDIVFFRFGWDRYWVPRTESRAFSEAWPGIDGGAAEYLVERGVKVVGCDVISIDGSNSSGCPAHLALLGSGVNIIENLTNLEQILGESVVFIAPLKIKQGSGAPLRAMAFK